MCRGMDRNQVLGRTLERCRARGIVIPTLAQMRNPELIPEDQQKRLDGVDLWDIHPANLWRITWKNDLKTGRFGAVNALEIPPELSGVKCRILGLLGECFPTGAHKVGAAFGCLIPRLLSGEFDPDYHKAVWPSTGNYCRGGAFDSAILGCHSIAILPQNMSRERFEWLAKVGSECIATPGCESNVKEIYDKCWELKKDPQFMIFNQFEEFGNACWHYGVTGPALSEAFETYHGKRLTAYISASGSSGTLAAGDYLKSRYPDLRIVAAEALQCPTLFANGFGDHRIEGIGDKHVPWIHHVKNTDAVAAIDDEDCMRLFRLFNEDTGRSYLKRLGLKDEFLHQLSRLGISSICNLLSAIKTAKYFDFGKDDMIVTVFTDGARMYQSRLSEGAATEGPWSEIKSAQAFTGSLERQSVDYFKELNYKERKQIHNLKYFTWVEQQGKSVEDLSRQWDDDFWQAQWEELPALDASIEAFNRELT